MKTSPVVPARLERDADGTPRSPDVGDRYHPREGALAQARQVFLAGNGLPGRWRGRERFVVLETGFGLGNNFLATWAAWRADPERCRQLHFISIEARPLTLADLRGLTRDDGLAGLAAELAAAWPPLTCNLHRLAFDAGRVELLLALGDVVDWLPQIDAGVDAFFLDGFAPALNPAMWQPRVARAMARIAVAGATVATWSAARPVRDALRSAGFEVTAAPGPGAKRDITLADFAPRFAVPATPRRRAAPTRAQADGAEPVLVIGAGLAGCAAAAALAEHGRSTLLLERREAIACEGSGNAGGIFHGVVHAGDGRHARWHRAAALAAQRTVALAIAGHDVRGNVGGALRIDTGPGGATAMRETIARLGLPGEYVGVDSAAAASERAGIAIAAPAWHYPGGGWVDPGGLAGARLAAASGSVELRLGVAVAALERRGDRWFALDALGRIVGSAATVVLANAGGVLDLLGRMALPLLRSRGQSSSIAAACWRGPSLPVAGSGYVLPEIEGRVWFGATGAIDDAETLLRPADHAANRSRLAALCGGLPAIDVDGLGGRVAFRWSSPDRLPLVGALPRAHDLDARLGLADDGAHSPRPEHARFAPRASGLFVFTALGSRGIASSLLGAQVLAAAITGAPSPVEADLLDAVDPARFASRAHRRALAV